MAGAALAPAAAPTLEFAHGRMQGSDGCNHYGGPYRAHEGAFQAGPDLVSTQMACPAPIMEQASAFMHALLGARGYRAEGAQLRLLGADGAVLATFAAAAPAR